VANHDDSHAVNVETQVTDNDSGGEQRRDDDPTFTGGGTCTGTSSSYTLRRYYACPGICR
jgi:hypothetical protein